MAFVQAVDFAHFVEHRFAQAQAVVDGGGLHQVKQRVVHLPVAAHADAADLVGGILRLRQPAGGGAGGPAPA